MKRFLVGLLVLGFATAGLRAQDAATQQQIDQINGRLQDLQDAQALQTKRLDAMEKEISDLRDKLNNPAVNNSASADDLKKLADQVQEIDKKRQDDRDLILKEIEKLGKVGGGSASGRRSQPVISTTTDNSTPAGTGPQKGYNYTIQRGDTLLAIAKAYRQQGIKVTTEQILKANPGLDAKNLIVGKTIFIPAPGQ